MRIGIHTWGSEGDIRPFFALARALTARGHTVTVAYTSVEGRNYDDLMAASGVRSHAVGAAYFKSFDGLTLAHIKGDPFKQLATILTLLFDPVAEEMFRDSAALCADTDLDIVHFLHHPAINAAGLTGKHPVAVFTAPVLPSGRYAPAGAPDLGPFNRLLWRLGNPLIDRLLGRRVNALRRREGLAPVRHFFGDWMDIFPLTLTAVSPTLFPRPDDWDERHTVCGYLQYPEKAAAKELPPALSAFLDAGEPPVHLTFGSMFAFGTDDVPLSMDLLARAVRIAGCRAILQAPESLIGRITADDKLFPLGGTVSHAALFPRCAAVVHHGGAGTTQAVARAGRPSVVVAHLVDQFFWGGLLRKQGTALEPLKRIGLTAEKLARHIRRTLDDASLARRAAELGTQVAAEDGVTRAVEMIEAHIRGGVR